MNLTIPENRATRQALDAPEQVAMRLARMQAAHRARLDRINALSHAREVIRKYEVRSPAELLALLQTVQAAVHRPAIDSLLIEFSDRLLELATDLDGELNGLGLEQSAAITYDAEAA